LWVGVGAAYVGAFESGGGGGHDVSPLHLVAYRSSGYCITQDDGNGNPPPAFSTTSTETIDYSIGFGFAALCYVSLSISRECYIDFVEPCREIRVFTCFGSPHHVIYLFIYLFINRMQP
jgi:hypothetical protein